MKIAQPTCWEPAEQDADNGDDDNGNAQKNKNNTEIINILSSRYCKIETQCYLKGKSRVMEYCLYVKINNALQYKKNNTALVVHNCRHGLGWLTRRKHDVIVEHRNQCCLTVKNIFSGSHYSSNLINGTCFDLI